MSSHTPIVGRHGERNQGDGKKSKLQLLNELVEVKRVRVRGGAKNSSRPFGQIREAIIIYSTRNNLCFVLTQIDLFILSISFLASFLL